MDEGTNLLLRFIFCLCFAFLLIILVLGLTLMMILSQTTSLRFLICSIAIVIVGIFEIVVACAIIFSARRELKQQAKVAPESTVEV